MAKPKHGSKGLKDNTASSINDFMNQFDPDGALIKDFKDIEIPDHIHSGSHILNAQLSGSILLGFPCGKISSVCGDPKTGKSFLVINAMRNAVKKGYFIFFVETEGSPDAERFRKQEIPDDKIRINKSKTPVQIINIIGPMTHKLLEIDKSKRDTKGYVRPKIMIVIDSITGLMSQQQYESANLGAFKHDMGTVIQEVNSMLSYLTVRAEALGIPVIVTQHTTIERTTYGSFKRPKGGHGQIFLASNTVMLTKSAIKDDDKNKIAISITSKLYEGRYAKPKDVKFEIVFDSGMNPFVGLDEYISWDICKIGQGKWIDWLNLAHEFVKKRKFKASEIVGLVFHDGDLKDTLSKPNFEDVIGHLDYMIDNGYLDVISGGEFEFTKKCKEFFDKDGKPIELKDKPLVPKLNSNIYQYIVGHLPGHSFDMDTVFNDTVFNDTVLNAIDKVARIDFLLGEGAVEKKDVLVDENADMLMEVFDEAEKEANKK